MENIFRNENFYVISGGPGAGKTALINALSARGYTTAGEAAREIIKQQMRAGGEGLPWKNRELYTRLMLEATLRIYREMYHRQTRGPVFFDRGLPDTFCYAKMIGMEVSPQMGRAARAYRYNPDVFLLPAWKEIYETDSERKQDWQEAEYTCEMMRITCREHGYNVIEVPKTSVDERAMFVLNTIAGSAYPVR